MLTIIGWLAHALSKQRERERKKKKTPHVQSEVCRVSRFLLEGWWLHHWAVLVTHNAFHRSRIHKKDAQGFVWQGENELRKGHLRSHPPPTFYFSVIGNLLHKRHHKTKHFEKKKTWKVEGEWSKMSKIYFRVRLQDIVRTSIWSPRPSFETGGGSFYGVEMGTMVTRREKTHNAHAVSDTRARSGIHTHKRMRTGRNANSSHNRWLHKRLAFEHLHRDIVQVWIFFQAKHLPSTSLNCLFAGLN